MSHLIRGAIYDADDRPLEFHTFDLAELCEKYCYRDTTSYEAFQKAMRLLREKNQRDNVRAERVHLGYDSIMYKVITGRYPDIPVQHHSDIYAFYRAVGWSYTRKKFWKAREVPSAPIH
jgi:predicted N-acyltransferase